MLRFPCLVLDHDDTVVASSKTIHYPAFLVTLGKLRPEHAEMPLDVFASYCYEPGFFKLCTEIMAFDEEEMTFSSGGEEQRHQYESVLSILEDKEYFFLIMGKNQISCTLRKSNFKVGSPDTFREFIEEKTGVSVEFFK